MPAGPETAPPLPKPTVPEQARRVFENVRQVLRYARPHWKGYLAAFLLMSLEAAASSGRIVLFYPILSRVVATAGTTGAPAELEAVAQQKSITQVVDRVVTDMNRWTVDLVPAAWVEGASAEEADRYATIVTTFFLFLLFILVMSAATYGETYLAERVRLATLQDVRRALCRSLLDQPVAFYDRQKRGEIIQRALGDVEGYATGLNLVLKDLAKGVLHVATTIVLILALSWKLTLVCAVGIPFFVPLYKLSKRTRKRSHKRQAETARRAEVLLQIFSGIRTVKAYGTEERRIAEFVEADAEVTRRSLHVQRAKSTADALTEFLNNFLVMVLAVGSGILLLRGGLSVSAAELFIFFGLTVNLYQPVKRLVKQFNNLQDATASIERTTEWLNLPPGNPDAPDARVFPGLREGVRFEDVVFEYVPGQPVLRGVSFEVPRGATVALVGPSGAGKSTLCDLLLRFYDPQGGRITVDGVDVRRYTRASLLARTSVVTQTPFLFHTTVRENVRQGKGDATDAEIEAAGKAAFIHDFISSLPRGYEETVGELGTLLSGGQRQRITIARALVRDPEILVLDEATASLDTASEKAVQDALERLRAGRTTLVVAHRLSTVRHADRIVVLDQGQVVEQGTHDDLVARRGLYARLVQMQDLAPAHAPASDPDAPGGAEPAGEGEVRRP